MQIHKVRLPDGRIVRPTEWSSSPLYSTVEIAGGGAALVPLSGFAYGLGGSVPGSVGPRGSTLVDTNVSGEGGVLPENQELLLYSIMVELFQVVVSRANYVAAGSTFKPDAPEVLAANVSRFQRDTLLELRIANTKEYMSHPVGFFPQAMGVHSYNGQYQNNEGNGPLVGTNGGVNIYEGMSFATPHRVLPGEAFEIRLLFPSGTINTFGNLDFGNDASARLAGRIYADGYRMRPVA
jgi:hypothetical protein